MLESRELFFCCCIFLVSMKSGQKCLKLRYDDEDVEKDQSLPGQFSVHLVEEIWMFVNFI